MDSTLPTSAKDTPSALACLRSTTSCTCGASARALSRTFIRIGLFSAAASKSVRACISFSWPRPPRSCRRNSKPLDVPRPSTGGGSTAKVTASLIWLRATLARSAIEAAESSLPRSDQSLSVLNASAAFCPLPEKLNPRITTLSRMPGSPALCASTCSATCTVRFLLAPGGNWMSVMV
ncbi:hypothetical protein D3C78_1151390 [compost metagenome]